MERIERLVMMHVLVILRWLSHVIPDIFQELRSTVLCIRFVSMRWVAMRNVRWCIRWAVCCSIISWLLPSSGQRLVFLACA